MNIERLMYIKKKYIFIFIFIYIYYKELQTQNSSVKSIIS